MRVVGNEVVGGCVEVGEIATTASRDGDLFADTLGMLEHNNLASTLSGRNGAEETRCPTTNHDDIRLRHAQSLSLVKKAKKDSEHSGPLSWCLLPTAFCLLLRTAIGLRRVVNLPRLDDKFFVVVNSVTVYVYAYLDLMLLAVVDVAGIKRKTVLAA